MPDLTAISTDAESRGLISIKRGMPSASRLNSTSEYPSNSMSRINRSAWAPISGGTAMLWRRTDSPPGGGDFALVGDDAAARDANPEALRDLQGALFIDCYR